MRQMQKTIDELIAEFLVRNPYLKSIWYISEHSAIKDSLLSKTIKIQNVECNDFINRMGLPTSIVSNCCNTCAYLRKPYLSGETFVGKCPNEAGFEDWQQLKQRFQEIRLSEIKQWQKTQTLS